MSYAADFALLQNSTFLNQVQMAMIQVAATVANEAISSKSAYAKRHSLAVAVLNTPSNYVSQFAGAAIEVGALVSGVADATVQSTITNIWNLIAGVSQADLQ